MSGKSAHEKEAEQVRELQLRNHQDRVVHLPGEVHEDVVVDAGLDKDQKPKADKKGEIHVVGGKAFVKVDAEFSQDDLLVFSQQIAKASQAVQV